MAHTFRGTTWRSLLGLETARDTFRRYREIRARERQYLDWPDPLGTNAQPSEPIAIETAPLNWVAR